MTRAVVFAYHNVGVRCLKVLLSAGVEVPLVVTHRDNPAERIWFDSVAAVCTAHGLPAITPDDPNTEPVRAQVQAAAPDFLFSFYYRHMLKAPLLALPRQGAYNMHGSLLPRYRGRVPVNWAVLRGETETGASLHAMEVKPDAGALVDQCAVPILADDTAREVFDKVVVAAEIVLARSLPALRAGTAPHRPQDLSQGSYFGGRRPEDGRLPADCSAASAHDLIRALAPPYPGAFLDLRGRRVLIEGSRHVASPPAIAGAGLRVAARDGALWLACADGSALRLLAASCDGRPFDAAAFAALAAGSDALPADPEPGERRSA